ncbi:aspartate aminotransferase family protein [Candidatus Atribacteria bacterium 1244-E10-H5-B2]|nr:MAG: aspartate aminotransferase family protein [Candidatus Atribacteria bacterium 1244-E10-H5-B2]
MKTKELIENEKKYLMQTYTQPDMVLNKGEGLKVWDLEGKLYYDFIGGIAVNALGYCHPKVVEAIKNQAEKLIHCSNLFYNEPQIILAKKLVEISCGDKVFFANSGAEVNEGAIKLAVKYFKEQNKDKHKIIYMKNSFHGRTIGTLAVTGKYKYQKDYLPLLPKFKQAIFNNLNSVKEVVDDRIAAIMVEPIQGESGINIASKEFIEGLRKLCNEKDMLLIFDEIQCGLGRTGKVFAYQYYNVEPDILTLAKSLGGGLPIGALIAKEKVASSFKPGDHGTTFGGNPVACAAAIAYLKVLQQENLITKCKEKGEYFKKKIEELKEKYPKFIKEARIIGLMVGLEIEKDGPEVVKKCFEKGVLINCTAGNVLRFLPPLIIEKEEIDYLIEVLDKIFQM